MVANNPIDALLDPDNNDNIFLYKADGTEVEFEQVAIIPVEDKLYAILHMVVPTDDVAADEALVFALTELADGQVDISYVGDTAIINAVFDGYNKLLDSYKPL